MHVAKGATDHPYTRYIRYKTGFILLCLAALAAVLVVSLSMGAAAISIQDVLRTLTGNSVSQRTDIILWHIRLPQAVSAMTAGAGLAASGAVMQAILRNPLGSPFTLGISHAAAFGAALAVMLLDGGVMAGSSADAVTVSRPWMTTSMAFVFCIVAALIIVTISGLRGATSETMVLSGVALGSLFTAGTMFLQFFADDVQLAAMVFWTFGDAARANWQELAIISSLTVAATLYFLFNTWRYNAVDAGDETAKGLGVRVDRLRLVGMLVTSLVTAVTVSFLGIIGFVGLVCPHMVRHLIGGDHRFLLPATVVLGSLLLLAADTAARLILAPHLLPVSILTAFMGAPVFIYLIIKGNTK